VQGRSVLRVVLRSVLQVVLREVQPAEMRSPPATREERATSYNKIELRRKKNMFLNHISDD
jgi:hypothetical protein